MQAVFYCFLSTFVGVMEKAFQKDNTRNFIIGNHIYAVSADGHDCVVHTEKGDFRHKNTCSSKPCVSDLPTMFFTALAGTYEGEAFPEYAAWLEYICEDDSPENRLTHARYVQQALQWHLVSDLTADEVLTFLSDNYRI